MILTTLAPSTYKAALKVSSTCHNKWYQSKHHSRNGPICGWDDLEKANLLHVVAQLGIWTAMDVKFETGTDCNDPNYFSHRQVFCV